MFGAAVFLAILTTQLLWPLTCRVAAPRLRLISDESLLRHASRRSRCRLGATL